MRFQLLLVIFLSISLAIGVWLLHTLYLDEPLRIVAYGMQIETPMTVAALAAILLGLLLGLAIKVIFAILFFPSFIKRWRMQRAERKRVKLLATGIKALAMGNHESQHKSFVAAAEAGIEPALTYYLAAAAADERRKPALLRRAANAEGDPMIKALADAREKLGSNNPSEAAEILRLAGAGNSDATAPLMMLMEASEQSGDIRGALDATQRLLVKQAKPSHALRAKAGNLTKRLLAGAGDSDEVRTLIGEVNKDRSPVSIAIASAKRLAAVRDMPRASAVLSKALKNNSDPELLAAIAECGTDKLVAEAITIGEKQIEFNKNDANLHRAVGRLTLRAKLLGQARKMFERAIELHPNRQNYLSLAELAELEGKSTDEVRRLYHRAADCTED